MYLLIISACTRWSAYRYSLAKIRGGLHETRRGVLEIVGRGEPKPAASQTLSAALHSAPDPGSPLQLLATTARHWPSVTP